jgi:hypothetical protein
VIVRTNTKRCCRTTPRCGSCPLRLAAELRAVNAIGRPRPDLPAHLADVPECLHKYEALLRPREATGAEERPVETQRTDQIERPAQIERPERHLEIGAEERALERLIRDRSTVA